jgi:hypothetical protein
MLKIPLILNIKCGCTFFPNMKSTSGKWTLTQAEEQELFHKWTK